MQTSHPNPPSAVPAPPLRLRIGGLGKLCVAIQADSPAELIERATAALDDSKFLELRLDSLPKPASALPKVAAFLAAHRDATAIATCRRKDHGGNFSGSLKAELEVLTSAAEAGCQIIDLEVESAEEAAPRQLDQLRARLRDTGTALLISFHDFTRTKNLEQAAQRIEAFRPDFIKVVSTAKHLADNLAVLKLIADRSLSARVVGIAMGEEGLISRVLGLRAGAAFTFASLADGAETAPGQVTARTLRDLYRVEQLDHATRIFGVAGNPIAHSLSPLMQNTAFRREGVNAVLLPLKVRELDDLLTLMRELPLAGAAVTMPLKQEILPHLADHGPAHHSHRRLQHAAHRRGRQDRRLQYRRGRRGPPAGKAPAAQGRADRRSRRGRRGAGRRLRPGGSGRGGLHRQRHPRAGRGAGQGGQGQGAEARAVRQRPLRRAHQRHSLRHGRQRDSRCPSKRTN